MSLFFGIEGLVLSEADKRRLQHPFCSGVILFSRNYADQNQLRSLTQEIRSCSQNLLIAVDHEGGAVQRFRSGFTVIPSAACLGKLFDCSPMLALELAEVIGVIIAYELRQFDIDFSFTPVLDLKDERSSVIGNRAFHSNPAVVTLLSIAFRKGLRLVGMSAVGKHYPGHGRVVGDSHYALPIDKRSYAERASDRFPFLANIADGIEGIMSAHILLPDSEQPAGFSTKTLGDLRNKGFEGAIISDDLDMAGAHFFTHPWQRVEAALSAGADAAMICNTFSDMDEVLMSDLDFSMSKQSRKRLNALAARKVDKEQVLLYYLSARALFSAYRHQLMA